MLNIILNEVRSYLRNGSRMFFTVFFPCACVFFLGTFLESVEVADKAVGELSIAYCTEGGDAHSVVAFEKFVDGLEKEGVLSAERVSAINTDGFDAAEYSAAVEVSGSDIIIHNGSDQIKNRAVKAVFNSYNQVASAVLSAVSVKPAVYADMENITEALDGSFVLQKDLGANRSMMDYYAVTMAVMILFMGSLIGGAETYTEEHECCTMQRLDASPVGRTAVFFGKIIGQFPMVFAQVLSVMLVSTLLFQAHYCNTVSGNLLLAAMFIAASLAALSVGVLLNLIFPRIPTGLVIMPALWLAMFFSGTFAMDIYIPGLTECMPMYIIQRAAFDLTVFGNTAKAIRVIEVSLVIFAVMLVLGRLKIAPRRGVARNWAKQ